MQSILQDENCLKELNVEREENGLLPIWVVGGGKKKNIF